MTRFFVSFALATAFASTFLVSTVSAAEIEETHLTSAEPVLSSSAQESTFASRMRESQSATSDDLKSRLRQVESSAATGEAIHPHPDGDDDVSSRQQSHQQFQQRGRFQVPMHRFLSAQEHELLKSATSDKASLTTSPLDFERKISAAWIQGFKDAKAKMAKHALSSAMSSAGASQVSSGIQRILSKNANSPLRLSSSDLMSQIRLAYQLGGLNSINRLLRSGEPVKYQTSIPSLKLSTAGESTGETSSAAASTSIESSELLEDESEESLASTPTASASSDSTSSFDINFPYRSRFNGGGFYGGYPGFGYGGFGYPIGGFYPGFGYPGFGWGFGRGFGRFW